GEVHEEVVAEAVVLGEAETHGPTSVAAAPTRSTHRLPPARPPSPECRRSPPSTGGGRPPLSGGWRGPWPRLPAGPSSAPGSPSGSSGGPSTGTSNPASGSGRRRG